MKWEPNEILILQTARTEELSRLLPHRTLVSIMHKRQRLGIEWTERWRSDEDRILQGSTDKTFAEIHRHLLPHRSILSISSRCSRLRLTRTASANTNAKSSARNQLPPWEIERISKDFTFRQIIDGCLLGDGYCGSKRFQYASTCRGHVAFVANLIENAIQRELSVAERRGATSLLDGREVPYAAVFTTTLGSIPLFGPIRERWYPSGDKAVPRDIVLDRLACLCWYLGDGCLSKQKRGLKLILCTNSFVKDDVEFLCEKLAAEIQSPCHPRKQWRANDQYVIELYGASALKFLKYVGDCPVEEYTHKWDTGGYELKEKPCPVCKQIITWATCTGRERITCSRQCYTEYIKTAQQ